MTERRKKPLLWIFPVLAVAILAAQALAAEEADPPQDLNRLQVGGLLFGDVYWVASQHDPVNKGIVSAWIRRGHLTFQERDSSLFQNGDCPRSWRRPTPS